MRKQYYTIGSADKAKQVEDFIVKVLNGDLLTPIINEDKKD
jgi:hypothetical protein